MNTETAIKQLQEIEKLAKEIRLAADGWDQDWQTLIAILMSARTTDKKTIPTAQSLFEKYQSIEKLSQASQEDIENIIRQVNFYKTKSKNVLELAKILKEKYNSKVPHEFEKLVELPGIGRKTANVFLAEIGQNTIGIDTHVTYISNYLGWTKHEDQEGIEFDLKKLFPEDLWGKLNNVLVRFGQTYPSFKEKDALLDKIKEIK